MFLQDYLLIVLNSQGLHLRSLEEQEEAGEIVWDATELLLYRNTSSNPVFPLQLSPPCHMGEHSDVASQVFQQ